MRTRTRRTVALVAVCTALAACGGGSGSSGPTETVPTATLQARMLTAPDVGSTWQLGPPVNEMDYGDAVQMPCADSGLNPTIVARLKPVAGVQFEPVDGSYKHLIEFGLTGEATRLDADLKFFTEGFEACNGKAAPDAPGVTIDIQKLDLGKLGDQRYGYKAKAKESAEAGAVWYVRMAIVRTGTVAVDLGLTEVLDSPTATPRITDADFVKIVQRAVTLAKG